MKKVLLSAFACHPTEGSEPGNGWNWSSGLAKKDFEVHCLTRIVGKENIEAHNIHSNLHFHYITLPFGLERLYTMSQPTMYLYYILWQWAAYKKAKFLHKTIKFDVAHHVTWGSLQMGSFLYQLNIPFIFGPTGGGQIAPDNFKKYFGHSWTAEERRKKVTCFFLTFNNAFRKMIRKAEVVIVSNRETEDMAKSNGATKCYLTLDAALPRNFFPKQFSPKRLFAGKLKLLWIGRLLPRKGIFLILDVMKELSYNRSITLTIVGDGPDGPALYSKIREYELEETVFWKGQVPYKEVKSYYEDHDIFFFASLRDSCPAQLIEAMAYGLPVVTINLHGQALIVDDERGILCNCDTPEIAIKELANAITYLFSHPEVVTQKSMAANSFAAQQMWPNKIDTIVNSYYPKI